jgi:hypothetical protein
VKVFLVYEPASGAPRTLEGAERPVFVREGFHWLAFLLPLPWLLWNRAWLGLLLWVLAMGVIGGLMVFGIGEMAETALTLLVGLLVGMEAPHLRGASLQRRGYRLTDIVAAPSRDEAERAFFAGWARVVPASPMPAQDSAPALHAPLLRPKPSPVLGLFPAPEGRR